LIKIPLPAGGTPAGKSIHLIRHGQSVFKAAFDSLTRVDPMIFDAPLSEIGVGQARALQSEVHALGVQLIVTSPLTRAIQTTLHAFGPDHAPIRVECLHRERLEHSGDVGRSPRALRSDFPGLAFDHLDDPWWHCDRANPQGILVESEETLLGRVRHFRDWLRARPETTIAVIGHGTFLNRLTGHQFRNCERLTLSL
jgi:broad specificity phosphatase PhoE